MFKIILIGTIFNYCYATTYNDKLGKLESSGKYKAENKYGYLGKYQFGKLALIDLGFISSKKEWLGKQSVYSKDDFLNSEEAQEIAINEWNNILDYRLAQCKAFDHINRIFNGIKLTKYSIRAGAHLLGANYVCNLLNGSDVIKKDANKTSVLKYFKEFSDMTIDKD